MTGLTLKPCPFCGGRRPHIGEHDRYRYVVCANCCCRTGMSREADDAVLDWNTRTDDAVERMVRAIRKVNLWDGAPIVCDAQLTDDEVNDLAQAALHALTGGEHG